MRILMLGGSGANGKTTLLETLVKMGTVHDVRVIPVSSSTRASAAQRGVQTELEGLTLTENEQYELQLHLLQTQLDYMEASFYKAAASDSELVVSDRTPFDYNGYVVQSQPWITRDQIAARNHLVRERMLRWLQLWRIDIWVLPAFPPWSFEADAYRHAPAGKNLAWYASMNLLLRDFTTAYHREHADNRLTVVHNKLDQNTTQERAYRLWQALDLNF